MKATARKVPSRTELFSLLFALLVVLLMAILSFRAWTAFSRETDQLAITRQIVDRTNALLSSLKDAETGQRGFLLTGEDRYLDPYRQSLSDIPATLNALTNVAATRSPELAQRVDALRPLVQDKMAELKESLDARREKGPEAALAIVLIDRGKADMDQIRRDVQEIQSFTTIRLTQYSGEDRASASDLGLLSTIGSASLFVLLFFSTITIQRATRRRQQLIQDLQESEGRTNEARDWLQTTIASIGDGVVATDGAGRVTLLNAVAQSLTGWTQDEAAGLPLEEIFIINNEETGAAVENPVTKALREGRTVGLANHTLLKDKDGRQIAIDDSAAPIRDSQGKISGVVLVFRDITERRETERREAAQRAALDATNQELQQFSYAASHDLREPLRTITAFAQMLELRGGSQLDEDNKKYLNFITSGAHRMTQLVDALLEYSKAGEVASKPACEVRMEEVLAAAVANLRDAIDRNQAAITHDPLPPILGNEVHFVELVQNLIANALKYRRQEESPRIHISAAHQGKEWRFSVSDNGQGIDPRYHSRVFELFKRLHGQEYPGTGIGLAMCKKIVERHGGRIWVESEPGKGSTFFFTMPAVIEFHRSASR